MIDMFNLNSQEIAKIALNLIKIKMYNTPESELCYISLTADNRCFCTSQTGVQFPGHLLMSRYKTCIYCRTFQNIYKCTKNIEKKLSIMRL